MAEETVISIEDNTTSPAPLVIEAFLQVAVDKKFDIRTVVRCTEEDFETKVFDIADMILSMINTFAVPDTEFKSNIQVQTETGAVFSFQTKGTMDDFDKQMDEMIFKGSDAIALESTLPFELSEDEECEACKTTD